MKIPQEEDRFSARKYVLALVGSAAVCAACGFACSRLLVAGAEPARAPRGGIYTGLMRTERDGERRRARDLERLESFGPVTSTTIHVPIDRAIELSLPRLLVARPEEVGVDEHLGARVPVDLVFVDSGDRRRRLGDLLEGKPALLVLAYERCPRLCGLVLRGAARAVKELGWAPGRELSAITVSFDPDESLALAREKQSALEREIPGARWAFLRGREPEIRALTDAAGFRYYRDPASGEYAHAAVALIVTPDGRISRYLYGVDFRARDLELSLVEAGQGRTGSTFERVLLRCYRWDGTTHRYEVAVLELMRATGAAIGVAVAGLLVALWRRER